MYYYFAVLWNVAKLQCKKGKVYIYKLSDGNIAKSPKKKEL